MCLLRGVRLFFLQLNIFGHVLFLHRWEQKSKCGSVLKCSFLVHNGESSRDKLHVQRKMQIICSDDCILVLEMRHNKN